MSYDSPPGALDRDLVLDFFWKFSAFESALKREGFLRKDRTTAEPDWKEFAGSLRGRFADLASANFRDAIDVLVANPPRRQVVRDGQLGWEQIERTDDDSDESFVLRLVKTVRNNLFHGGKYPDGPIEEVARDRTLLRAALAVLEGCCQLRPKIARWADAALWDSGKAMPTAAGDSVVHVPPDQRKEALPPTPGMIREEAIAVEGLWAGLVKTDAGMTSGWHHHGDYDTSIYVVSDRSGWSSDRAGRTSQRPGPLTSSSCLRALSTVRATPATSRAA